MTVEGSTGAANVLRTRRRRRCDREGTARRVGVTSGLCHSKPLWPGLTSSLGLYRVHIESSEPVATGHCSDSLSASFRVVFLSPGKSV